MGTNTTRRLTTSAPAAPPVPDSAYPGFGWGGGHMTTPDAPPARETAATIMGPPFTLRLGMWSAWGLVGLYLAYAAFVAASGVASGPPQDPAWAIAEILTIVGAPLQVIMFAALHESAPPRARLFSQLALGWMLVMTALTVTVHFVELTVARRIDLAAEPGLAGVFAWGQPSLLQGVEFTAWHLFFGLALLCAAVAFGGQGLEAAVRTGLGAGGVLCLAGLLGPALDKPGLRVIGVVGYAVVFPVVCVMLGFVFKQAEQRGRGGAAPA
jgi:hypothetical protein